MMALAMDAGTPRFDAARWGLCFAAVAMVHAAVAMALLRNASSSDSDFNAGAPVVMIELPEAPAALSNPPTDLAPGLVEPESEQTPPPKEETKPPEQVAEVALPEPEPPKPEPPAEEKPPTALPSVAVAMPVAAPVAGAEVEPMSDAVRRWESALVAHIERFKRYPAEARARGQRGYAKVAFTIDRDGRLRESHIVESSGSQEFDRESLAMLTRSQPMPKPPGEVRTEGLSFVVPVRFSIK
jgi:periplasmic protein TonB